MPSRCKLFESIAVKRLSSIGRDRDFESITPDGIHDLRVACRRARVALAEFKPCVRGKARRDARSALRDIGRRLGNVRELDVSIALVLDGVAPAFEGTPATEYARRKLHEARAAEEFRLRARPVTPDALFRELDRILEHELTEPEDCLLKHARTRLTKRLDDLETSHHCWRKSELEGDLHRLRIEFKTLRYAMEAYGVLYGEAAKELQRALERVQESLGHWNDRRILREHLSKIARDAHPALRAELGELTAAIAGQVDELRAAAADETKQFFRKSQMREFRKVFEAPTAPCCRASE